MSAKSIYCVVETRWIQHLVVPVLKQIRCLALRCLRTTIRVSFRRKTLLLIGERQLGVRQTAQCTDGLRRDGRNRLRQSACKVRTWRDSGTQARRVGRKCHRHLGHPSGNAVARRVLARAGNRTGEPARSNVRSAPERSALPKTHRVGQREIIGFPHFRRQESPTIINAERVTNRRLSSVRSHP